MMTNLTCVDFQSSSFDLRNNCKENLYPTLSIFVVEAAVAAVLAVISFIRYNSIGVLNLTIHIDAISNTWWILYFVISFLRAVLNSVKYAVNFNHVKALEVSDWCIGAIKVLILCFALNYQRKYRSSDHIAKEIDTFSKSGKKSRRHSCWHGMVKVLSSSGLVLSTFALVTLSSSILACIFISQDNATNNGMEYLFWIYVGSLCWNGVVSIILAFFAIDLKSKSGPYLATKVILFLALFLSLPIQLPIYIWKRCAVLHSYCFVGNMFSIFDVAILLSIASLLLFFLLMKMEYVRLKQECQFAMLSEVQKCRC